MAVARRYLLDTNIASYVIKGNLPVVRERLQKIPVSHICISAITQAELLFGVAKKPEATSLRTAVNAFLAHLDVLSWGSQAAQRYAELREKLERKGRPLGNMDMLIAAHALANGAVLVTSDAAFKNIEEIRTEDWTKE